MKYVTQITEKRINELIKNFSGYGWPLQFLLDRMKEYDNIDLCESIKDLREQGIRIESTDRQFRISCCEYVYNGMSINYSDLFHITTTYDLCHVDIKDFNKLVKVIYDKEKEYFD